jgi:ABC-type nitrate/sulfonate/bicarbonate transport system substrate-binding protein
MLIRHLSWLLGGIFLVLVSISATDAQQVGSGEKIRIAYGANSLSFFVAFVAKDAGFYAKNGFDAELIMVGPSPGMAALLSGYVDYVELLTGTIRLAAKGAPVRATSATVSALFLSMAAQPQYKSVRDLNGKIVGVSFLGGLHHLSAKRLVHHFGLEPDRQVKIIPIGDQNLLYQALKIGRVDAVMVDPPFSVMLKREGFPILARVADVLPIPAGGLGTTLQKINNNRSQVKRVLKAELEALRYLRSNPEEAKKLMQKRFAMDAQMAEDTYNFVIGSYGVDGRLPREGVKTLLDLEKENRVISQSVTVEQVVDFSLLDEVLKEQ